MRHLPLLLLLCTLSACPLRSPAQEEGLVLDSLVTEDPEASTDLEPADWHSVSDDTLAVRDRAYDSGAIQRYKADPELDYDRVIPRHELLLERFLRWLSHMLERFFGTRGGGWVFEHLDWIIVIGAATFLGFYFRRRLFGGLFAADPTRARQVREIEEDIERIDLDGLLNKAERSKDWRLAVRYQYLKVLRRLVDEGRITWEPRYTDQDYLAQLKDPASRATFSELSFLFKWVWYGDAPVDEQRYHRVRPTFEAFHQRPTAR